MADISTIEWTDSTWNVITGCSVFSPGCKRCYAMTLAGTRLKNHPSRAGLTTDTKAGPVWTGEVRFNEQWLDQPLTWSRPRMIFVCAHSDLFHEAVPDVWIDRIFAVMALCQQHRFQVLTKRSARMLYYMLHPEREAIWMDAVAKMLEGSDKLMRRPAAILGRREPWVPLPNVWLGCSAEDQERYDERRSDLDFTPAAVRYWSLEPLLGPIDMRLRYSMLRLPDWVIVGGESGDGARPMHASWARSLRDQCAEAGVPYFFKQWGGWLDSDQFLDRLKTGGGIIIRDGQRWDPPRPLNYSDAAWLAEQFNHPFKHNSDGTTLLQMTKKRAGRLLDGIEHNAIPEARA